MPHHHPDALLWHYTSAAALAGIIVSHDQCLLWSTDVRSMPDHSEYVLGAKLFTQALFSQALMVPISTGVSLMRMWLQLQSEFGTGLPPHLPQDPKYTAVHYATCFTKSRDSPHHWDGYGGGGFSLGFAPELLRASTQIPSGWLNLRLDEVSYVDANGRVVSDTDLLGRLSATAQEYASGHKAGPVPQPGRAEKRRNLYHREILPTLAMVKHSTYQPEQETRMLISYLGPPAGVRHRATNDGTDRTYVITAMASEALRTVLIAAGDGYEDRKTMAETLIVDHGLDWVTIQSSSVGSG